MSTTPTPDRDLLAQIREALKPKGTAPVVKLFLRDNTYYDEAYVKKILADLSTRLICIHAGFDDELTPLEKLAVQVLLDSAYIKQEIPR